ncbi:MAG TPA: hypothetical protein VFW83_07135 [Bryobacteraceae bacterium]|nr:hypothetical protein [Bryobacteraceae bacterium]
MKITSINERLREWPRAIESEEENERVWAAIDELSAKGEPNLTPGKLQLLQVLVDLAEEYESRVYPVRTGEPRKLARKAGNL